MSFYNRHDMEWPTIFSITSNVPQLFCRALVAFASVVLCMSYTAGSFAKKARPVPNGKCARGVETLPARAISRSRS